MPTLLQQGIVHNLKGGEIYAMPTREVIYNSEASIEISPSINGPWNTPVVSGLAGGYSDQIIADGAVAYWRLDETGNPVKSTIAGVPDGTASGSIAPGIPGALSDGNKAVNFNFAGPADGQVSVPVGLYSTFGTGEFSIECWFKRANIAISADEVPIVLGSIFTASSIAFRVSAANITFILKDSVNVASTALTPTAPYLDDRWHHMIGVVRRGTPNDTTEIWIDGVLKNSSTVPTGRIYTISTTTTIGANIGTNEWQGGVDEVAIYKTALSPQQIANHYAARAKAYQEYVIVDGAVAYWRLNETSGTVVKSLVSGVPDGTISGAVTLGINGALSDGDKGMSFNPAGAADGGIIIGSGNFGPGLGSFTLECWMRHANIAIPQFECLCSTNNPGGNSAVSFRLNSATSFQFLLRDGVGASAGPNINFTTWLDDNWHHLVGILRRDSTNDVTELWIDGVLNISLTTPIGKDFGITSQPRIGAIGTTNEWVGQIDEVSFYKTALTPAQIQSHYQASKSSSNKPIKGGFIRSSADGKFICKS